MRYDHLKLMSMHRRARKQWSKWLCGANSGNPDSSRRTAKRPGRTVCFILFIEMSYYKSSRSLHGAWMGFSEAGKERWLLCHRLGAHQCPVWRQVDLRKKMQSFIIQNTSSACNGRNGQKQGEKFARSRRKFFSFRGKHIGPRGDDYEACMV